MWRRSNALLGRRESFSGDRGRIVTRRPGRATTVSTGLDARFERLASPTLLERAARLVDFLFKAASEHGCNDFGRSRSARGEMFGPFMPVLIGGVMFSLLLKELLAAFATRPCRSAPFKIGTGKEVVEYTVCDSDGVFDFFDDDPTLLVGDLLRCERLK